MEFQKLSFVKLLKVKARRIETSMGKRETAPESSRMHGSRLCLYSNTQCTLFMFRTSKVSSKNVSQLSVRKSNISLGNKIIIVVCTQS